MKKDIFEPREDDSRTEMRMLARADPLEFMKRADALTRQSDPINLTVNITLDDVPEGSGESSPPVARVTADDGKWHLYYRAEDSNNDDSIWKEYHDGPFVTLAIPALIVAKDADGVFWRER